jgi:hypothetical protein
LEVASYKSLERLYRYLLRNSTNLDSKKTFFMEKTIKIGTISQ